MIFMKGKINSNTGKTNDSEVEIKVGKKMKRALTCIQVLVKNAIEKGGFLIFQFF